MRLLEQPIENHWNSINPAPEHQPREVESETMLVDVQMTLAGFAIENFCKGYLAVRLCPEEKENLKRGVLPKSLKSHDLVDLVKRTAMALSSNEQNLVARLSDAVSWRGRYPSAISHEFIRPFIRMEGDIHRIETLLQRLRRHVGANEKSS